MSTDQPVFDQRAEDLYVARSVADDAIPTALSLTFADLVRYLSDATACLTAEQWRSCREDPRLRADYGALKRNFCVAELPQAAAASRGDVDERNFPGGRLRIVPSTLAGQVYLILTVERALGTPRSLLIEGKDGEMARITLPPPDPDGTMLVIQDTSKNEADARAVRLLRDPSSSGVLLP
jgi:hypothetical protein